MKTEQEIRAILGVVKDSVRFFDAQNMPPVDPHMLVMKAMVGVLSWVVEEAIEDPNIATLVEDWDKAIKAYLEKKEDE